MRSMRLQFSLATLLVCITVLAVVCAVCVKVTVRDFGPTHIGTYGAQMYNVIDRPPTASEIAQRLALWGPASIAATLGVLWIGRRVLYIDRHSSPSDS